MSYQTQDNEAGNIIDEFTTLEEAQAAIAQYVADDKAEGTYTPEFYCIYDTEKEETVEVSE